MSVIGLKWIIVARKMIQQVKTSKRTLSNSNEVYYFIFTNKF